MVTGTKDRKHEEPVVYTVPRLKRIRTHTEEDTYNMGKAPPQIRHLLGGEMATVHHCKNEQKSFPSKYTTRQPPTLRKQLPQTCTNLRLISLAPVLDRAYPMSVSHIFLRRDCLWVQFIPPPLTKEQPHNHSVGCLITSTNVVARTRKLLIL